MASEKTVNYTAEQTSELVARYTGGETVEALATVFGRTTRSVIAKLSREGVYEKADTKTEGAKRMTKAEYLAEAEKALQMAAGSLSSMEKGSLESCKALYTAAMKAATV